MLIVHAHERKTMLILQLTDLMLTSYWVIGYNYCNVSITLADIPQVRRL